MNNLSKNTFIEAGIDPSKRGRSKGTNQNLSRAPCQNLTFLVLNYIPLAT
jgi:hypothetical protein